MSEMRMVVCIDQSGDQRDFEEQTGKKDVFPVPGKSGVVTRPNVVTVEALDINMEPFSLTGEGLLARAICHECEHLDGILYVEHVEGELHDVNYEEEDGE